MRPARPAAGFTLIELMIVVAIIAVLAVVAVGGIARLIQRSRKAEIGAVFAAFATGEETYKSENNHYVALSSTTGLYNSSGAPDSTFYPPFAPNEPSAKSWQPTEPLQWLMAAFNYPERAMYCSYSGNAGIVPQYPTADTEWGGSFPANFPVAGPWYYLAAECKWNGSKIQHYEMRFDEAGTVIPLDGE